MKKNVLCLLSGGTDSFVLTDFLLRNEMDVSCLFIDYGHISAINEYEAFLEICEFKNIQWYQKIVIHNFGENLDTGLTNIENTNSFFPSRNLLLITIASAFLNQVNSNYIAIGTIKTAIQYPDCKRSYFDTLEHIINESIKREIRILTPIDNFTKIDIVRYSHKYQLPLEISYSCDKGVRNHCRNCPSCKDRFEALDWLKSTEFNIRKGNKK